MATSSREAAIYAVVVGALIQQLREREGLTQGQLAERVGVTQSAISRIERGQARPDPFEMRALADTFGMTTADFARLIDDAFARAVQTGQQAIRTPKKGDWWGAAFIALGVIGVMGLAAFAVAAVLHDAEEREKKNPAEPPKAKTAGGMRTESTKSRPA